MSGEFEFVLIVVMSMVIEISPTVVIENAPTRVKKIT
jgi:hypothetical protein